jgi:RNA polymerase sigma factor (sigma-70 family)
MTNGTFAPAMSSATPQAPGPAAVPSDRELLDRFHRQRDQAAFEVILRRHGPMVLGVCRRILPQAHDAEDAFQATFLVLVRKAGVLRDPGLLANWLYGVAYRVARKARARLARRSEYERQAASMPAADVPLDLAWREMRSLLDEELQALPAKYQAPLVLCYLEGLSNEEAARRLGWPSGSISYRLAKGRELLRQRLARRDRALSTEMFASVLLTKVAADSLPEDLFRTTVQAALDLAGKQPTLPAAGWLKSLVPDLWTAVVAVLVLLVSFGLVTSVVAHSYLDAGRSAAPSCH